LHTRSDGHQISSGSFAIGEVAEQAAIQANPGLQALHRRRRDQASQGLGENHQQRSSSQKRSSGRCERNAPRRPALQGRRDGALSERDVVSTTPCCVARG
jgi:hypothetical protein